MTLFRSSAHRDHVAQHMLDALDFIGIDHSLIEGGSQKVGRFLADTAERAFKENPE